MTEQRNILSNYHKFSEPQQVRIGDGRTVEVLGVGNLGVATEKGNIVQFGVNHCHVRGKLGQLHGMGTRMNDGLYQLNCKTSVIENASVASNSSMNGLDIWYQRPEHVSISQLQKLVRSGNVSGLKFQKSDEASFCERCTEGKMHRKPFKSVGEIRSKGRLQLVHSDVCGPMQSLSIGGYKYFVHLLMITKDAAECIS
ncbi:uncharacterized protein LOC143234931 [Tachypleus tridentatus]|uniref:uncharacterized protein LOC143234931 n=1 Tax=Tachypleus tridentatus TaxID=6853 RepID=UPI003FD07193